jgi:hypothetical protein
MAPVQKRSASGKGHQVQKGSRGSHSASRSSMSSSTSTSRGSGTNTRKPKLTTPHTTYVRDNEESDGVSGEESNQTPSDNERPRSYKTAPSSSKKEDSQDGAATNNAKKKKRIYEYSLRASSSKRQQAVELTNDGEEPSSTQPQVLRETPMALWKTIDNSMKQVTVEKPQCMILLLIICSLSLNLLGELR